MAINDWALEHARVASKEHKRITLDDKIVYFQTLATALRAPWEAIPVGAQDSPKGIGVRVLETAEGGNPTTVQFRFPRALDDPGYVWLRFDWEHLSYVPFTPPAVGERKSIAGGL